MTVVDKERQDAIAARDRERVFILNVIRYSKKSGTRDVVLSDDVASLQVWMLESGRGRGNRADIRWVPKKKTDRDALLYIMNYLFFRTYIRRGRPGGTFSYFVDVA